MEQQGYSMIGGFAIFSRAPWYLRYWPFYRKHSLHRGNNVFIVVENFIVDNEWVSLLKKAKIRVKLYRPRKPYSPYEVRRLSMVILEQLEYISTNGISAKEFALIANQVRPGTFKDVSSIKDLCNNKYYTKVM
jgi:hypothetical protein